MVTRLLINRNSDFSIIFLVMTNFSPHKNLFPVLTVANMNMVESDGKPSDPPAEEPWSSASLPVCG